MSNRHALFTAASVLALAAAVVSNRVNAADSIPPLVSLPGAPHTIYLDFDGHEEPYYFRQRGTLSDGSPVGMGWPPHRVAAYQGGPERIREIWQRVAEDFAPFDVNVTTIQPSALAAGSDDSVANQNALRVAIGDYDGAPANDFVRTQLGWTDDYEPEWVERGGVAFVVNSYQNDGPNTAWVFPGPPPWAPRDDFTDDASWIANGASHEAGHVLGLVHLSGSTQYRSALMNAPSGDVLTTWDHRAAIEAGPAVDGNGNQDDVAWLRQVLGLRPDDHSDLQPPYAPPTPLEFHGFLVDLQGAPGNRLVGRGVIERLDDFDIFSFEVVVAGLVHVSVVPGLDVDPAEVEIRTGIGPNLRPKLSVYDASLALVGQRDPDPAFVRTLSRQVSFSAAPGPYYAVVESHGDAGELGHYTVAATGPVNDPGGARVLSAHGGSCGRRLQLAFDRRIDPTTFDSADVVVIGPTGVALTGPPRVRSAMVTALPPDHPREVYPTRFELHFTGGLEPGNYRISIGPQVMKPQVLGGQAMNQDGDATNGEAFGDRFIQFFTVRPCYQEVEALEGVEVVESGSYPWRLVIGKGSDLYLKEHDLSDEPKDPTLLCPLVEELD